jgi:hypothetical protein
MDDLLAKEWFARVVCQVFSGLSSVRRCDAETRLAAEKATQGDQQALPESWLLYPANKNLRTLTGLR